jgi:hypothetical protein
VAVVKPEAVEEALWHRGASGSPGSPGSPAGLGLNTTGKLWENHWKMVILGYLSHKDEGFPWDLWLTLIDYTLWLYNYQLHLNG